MGNGKSSSKIKEDSEDSISASIIKPIGEHKYTIIFLHGLGDNGQSWRRLLKEYLPPNCKLICPNAPAIPVTMNGGGKCPAWFDIYGIHPDSEQDVAGLEASKKQVLGIIELEEQKYGIPPSRIILGGFSQGGALALFTALTGHTSSPLGGIVLLSSWIPLHKRFLMDKKACVCNRDVPMLVCHGQSDAMVPVAFGQMSANLLLHHLEFKALQLKVYPGLQHYTSSKELEDVKSFLCACLKEEAVLS